MNKKNVVLESAKKNRMKKIRSAVQLVTVILLAIVLISAIFLTKKREKETVSLINNEGFIALSYFGLSRNESPKYVSKKNLEKQLELIASQGYKTITQQDIIDYYEKNKPLPEKALYLSFEDGRTDSSIFAQNILEKLNYKATMFTYANKMDSKDTKFLKPKDLLLMKKSNYWELGSNGYRLTYINVFNDKGQSLGIIDENNVPDKTTIEYYNHYLMDFIRNEYMIPSETRNEMEVRITNDYKLMKSIYKEVLGSVPKAYAIMHANSLHNNMDYLVENSNNQQIKETFSMNFNQELDAFNGADADLYNLTRLQVSPYWPTNHLMMKIQHDSKKSLTYENGNEKLAKKWTVIDGAAEFNNNEIILTSAPSKEGRVVLNKNLPNEYKLSFALEGNIVGQQSIYLKYDKKSDSYVRVALINNEIVIFEKLPGAEIVEKERIPLNKINWDKELYSLNKATVYSYQDTQEGSRINEEEYPRNLTEKRVFNISVKKGVISINVDQELSAKFKVNSEIKGEQLGFGAQYSPKETINEQYADDIYDTIMEDLIIADMGEKTIFTNRHTKFDKVKHQVKSGFNTVIDYFIETF